MALAAVPGLPLPDALAGDTAHIEAANVANVETSFDRTFSPAPSAPRVYLPPQRALPATYPTTFASRIAALASADQGRIGVAALDLGTGRSLEVLGDQPFPLASTSKIAIAATFLDGVDRGAYRLDAQYPLMVPLPSKKFEGSVAPVRAGARLSALSLIELSLTRSDNHATDALLAAVGGPRAVNAWLRRAGVSGFHLDRDIATLVRDDGAINPAVTVDTRDATTPLAMVRLLTGLYRGQWLSSTSQQVLLGAMGRCITGKRRMRANLPQEAMVAHKTGTLNNTSSDVGIITTPDGRAMAVAIYVTGQGTKLNREARIATIARAIYDGYGAQPAELGRTAVR
ncbi:MAG: serine hydrolase [Novosphingobium sp.]